MDKQDPSEKVETSYLSDLILGGQDGIVNVLGVVLGVASSGSDIRVVLVAGLAAAFAESVSMAAVEYTSSLADKDFYEKEVRRMTDEIRTQPDIEKAELRVIYEKKGFSGELLDQIINTITSDEQVWVKNMMLEELGLEPVNTTNIFKDTAVVGISAILGSIIPLVPFLLAPDNSPVIMSLIVSGASLFFVGVYQAKTYVGNWLKKGIQMVLIGLGAALVGYIIGKLFQV